MKKFLLIISLLHSLISPSAQANGGEALTFNTDQSWYKSTVDAYKADLGEKFNTNIEVLHKDWVFTMTVKVYVDAPPATAVRIASYIMEFISSGKGNLSVATYKANKHKIAPFKENNDL